MGRTTTVELEIEGVEHETEAAILVLIEGNQVWLPRSQVIECDEENGVVEVTEWIAMEKGLI